MQLPDIFGQFRPLFSLAGSITILVGLVDFLGFGNIPGSGLETMAVGFFVKNI
jgi:hypothetical protein